MIAISQDPLGKQGTRVSGGDLYEHALRAECCSDEGKRREAFCSDVDCDAGLREEASAPPRERFDAVATPSATGCSSSDPGQRWVASPSGSLNASGVTLKQTSSGLCLGVVDDSSKPTCGSQVTVMDCGKLGAKWTRVADPAAAGQFALLSELNHQPLDLYGGADPGRRNADLQTCASPEFKDNNLWALTAGALSSTYTKGCVHTANVTVTTPKQLGPTNVWARPMVGGKVAMFFFNVGTQSADVACDAACFAAAGVSPSATKPVAARDLIAHSDLPDLTAPGYVAKGVPGSGGSVTLLLTPKAGR